MDRELRGWHTLVTRGGQGFGAEIDDFCICPVKPGGTHHDIDWKFFMHLPPALNQKHLEAGYLLFPPGSKSSQAGADRTGLVRV